MTASGEFIKTMINTHKLLVFSKTFCPYCKRVVSLLQGLGAKPFVVELDERNDTSDCQAELKAITGRSTVPQVFVDQKFIGGCDDTVALNSSGKLVPLLQASGILQK